MKPNFNEMTVPELRKYVIAHRDDMEALRALFHHPSLKYQQMPPLVTEDGVPIAENIRLAEEAIKKKAEIAREKQKQRQKEIEENLRQKLEQEIEEKLRSQIELEVEQKLRHKLEQEIEARLRQKIARENQQEEAIPQKAARDREKQTAKELEAKSFGTIEEGWVNSRESKLTVVTQTEIELFREQLLKDYPQALATLDTIQECEGNLEDAAQVIVLEAGEEEVQSELLEKLSSLCRSLICKEDIKEELPVLIAAITEFLASGTGFPPGLATPIAIFVTKRGMKNFCQSTDSNSNSQ
jgi:flagellar motor protein MotB